MMYKPLSPNEYAKLDQLRINCEKILQDPFLCEQTNVLSIYNLVMEQIFYETDPYLENEVYTIPFILKPVDE